MKAVLRGDGSAPRTQAFPAPDDARYPSYKSLDEFIDLDLLRSLDPFLIERIGAHAAAEADTFFLNQHRLDEATPYQPGVREIWLSRTRPGTPYDYLDLDIRPCGSVLQRRRNLRRSCLSSTPSRSRRSGVS